ncbi:MAG TPA: gamma carbonic anhydrase family protein [Bacillota bacterium]|nr:gamma carbonic anhydrase family protein [Bacillota bacterium]HOA35580.1 gamma carbonic anhydrase family protein [Bacillota bacterium]HOJ83441.1 gamma carbonic anhydrase family protein [Bacillota bacterium]HOL15957.1 gamma carbonic anhydrase family protein [Bacillota bacterium]HPZ11717.1 gamma carbonic anhydrase family protein [Bacillota bacterium]
MIIMEYGGKKPQIGKNVFIAPGAAIIGDVIVEEGASIWFGAVIRGDFGRIYIGSGSSIQDNCVIHVMPDCETVIGENVTVAHGAVLHGCRIGRGAIIGMRAVVQDFCEIGEEAMIAAGSVVTDRTIIPARHLAAGVPARVKKEIAGTSLMWVSSSAASYRKLAQSYLQQGMGKPHPGSV